MTGRSPEPGCQQPRHRQLIRFASTGVSATLLHALIALSLIEWWFLRSAWANAIAYVVCTVFSYALNTRWSFSNTPNLQNFRRFMAVSLLGFMLALVLAWATDRLGWPPFAGVFAVVSVVPLVSFVMHRHWTYR